MDDEFREDLPAEVVVSLNETMGIVTALEQHLEWLVEANQVGQAEAIDAVLGRITRWIWPLLRDLDEQGGGYDD